MIRAVGLGGVLLLVACTGSGDPATTTAPTEIPASSTTAPVSAPTTQAPTPVAQVEPADLVFVGGVVRTMDDSVGVAQGVAVAGGLIEAVGTNEEIEAYVGPETLVVDLDGRALIPGFVDPHTHLLSDITGETMFEGEQIALENGITTLADASVEPELLGHFQENADDLRIRVRLYLGRTSNCGVDFGKWYEEYPPGYELSETVAVQGVKIFTDGGTCDPVAASQPFLEGVPIAPPFHEPEFLREMVTEAHDAGYQLLIHAQGDRAITDAQDALESVLDGAPNDLRHRIDHNSIASKESVPRYEEIGIHPVLFGYFQTCNPGPLTDFFKEIGEDWAAIVNANPGVTIAWHGDDPGWPPLSPLLDLASYVTKADVADDGSFCMPEPWLARKAISADQALAMMTINSAYVLGLEDEVGSITPGKAADLVVVTTDPLAVEPMELWDIELAATYLGGVAAYCAPGYEDVCVAAAGDEALTVTASASGEGRGPGFAIDGNTGGESFWSSGDDAPQWIQLDFAEPTVLNEVRLHVFQNPESDTVHELELYAGGEVSLVHTFEGFTATGDVLVWNPPPGFSEAVGAIRVTTLESASWPEWLEIEYDAAS